MNNLYCVILLFITCGVCNSQNLVPNGDFEEYSGCPQTEARLDSALFWMNPSTNLATSGTPDYYNQCAGVGGVGVPDNWSGYTPPHSGVAYSGMYIWSISPLDSVREYIEAPLTSALVANTCYHFEMYVNLGDRCRYSTADIGVYFSNTAVTGVNNYYPLPFTPQINNNSLNIFDTLNWALVSGNYTAAGGESFLLIGNFKDDLNTTATFVNSNAQFSFIYVFVDDVSLCPCSSPCTTGMEEYNKATIGVYPNPVSDKLNITINNNDFAELIIYDISSRKLFDKQFSNAVSINTGQLAKGIYIYEVRNKNGVIKNGKLVKE